MAYVNQFFEMALYVLTAVFGFVGQWKELFSALVGAVIGGLYTSRATTKAHGLQAEEKKLHSNQTLNRTLVLIRCELQAAWTIYRNEYALELLELPRHQPYMTLFPIGQNPFPIYDSAPACLAEAPTDISVKIVHIYMRAKGLIETIKMNNEAFRLASAHARDAIREADKNHTAGEIDLNVLYTSELHYMGEFLHMAGLAEAMQKLTGELDDHIEVLIRKINDFVGQEAQVRSFIRD